MLVVFTNIFNSNSQLLQSKKLLFHLHTITNYPLSNQQYLQSLLLLKKKHSVLCSQNTTQNSLNTTNNDDIQSCETTRKQNYSITNTSTSNNQVHRIGAMSVHFFKFKRN